MVWTTDNHTLGRAEEAIAVALEARRILGIWIANAISDRENGWMSEAEYADFCRGADVMMKALDMTLEDRRYLRGKLGIANKGRAKRKQD